MAVIVTRETTQTDGTSPKGSPLTNAEVDTNFINLNDNKVEVSGAIVFEANAGEALTKGDAVYVSGISGNKPVVSKADADDASKMPAFGLAETDATLNSAVNVVTFGTIYELDTSGFSAGDTVYVSTSAGVLSNSAPTGESSLIQNMGRVIRSHASAGSIKVGGAGRTNATPNLNDGNVFIGNASNQSVARALTASDIQSGTFADARIAESNVTQHEAALSITESQISDLQSYLTSVALNDVSDVTITSASNGQVLKYNGSAWINDTDAGGIEYTDLSVTTNAAGTAALSYNNANGVFTYTPPDLSSYLTSYTETDPVFSASASSGITSTNISNWNTAYGWGDHASAGYLTSYTETDPVFSASAASGITSTNITNWNTAYGWGNHASAGYLTSFTETDPTVPSHVKSITTTEKSNWNTAYSWGNHASAGYALTSSLSGYVSRNFEDSSRNLVIPTNTSVLAAGLALESSAGNFLMQLYGTGGNFGFLDAQWGNWDLKKTSGGQLEIDVGGTLRTVWHTGNDGSGSGLDADTVDGIQAASFLRSDTSDTMSGSFTATGEVNAYSGAIDLRSDGIYFESGNHCITWNDGNGNFNIRVGNGPSETCTEAGYIFQDEWSQSSGWREFNVSSASLAVGNSPSWRPQIYYDYNEVSLRYQGSEKLATTSGGVDVTGDFTNSGDIQAKAQIRAQGWWNTPTGGYGDAAVEIGMSGGDGYILSYSRNSSSYGTLNFSGTSFNFDERGGTTTIENNEVWHAGNDGSGSGLDADTLDGIQGASFLRSDANDTATGAISFNTFTLSTNGTYAPASVGHTASYPEGIFWHTGADYSISRTAGAWSGNYQQLSLNWPTGIYLDGGTIYGLSGVRVVGNNNSLIVNGNVAWNAGNDGSGSGLDADTVDGIQGGSFLRSDADDTSTGLIEFQRGLGIHREDGVYVTPTSKTKSVYWKFAESSQLNSPPGSGTWRHVATIQGWTQHSSSYPSWQMSFGNGAFGVRQSSSSSAWAGWQTVWTSGNDGSGSGLDADTVDGIQGASFLRSDAADTATGNLTFTGSVLSNGYSSGDNWLPYTDGNFYFRADCFFDNTVNFASTLTAGGNAIWHAGNDGSGSGLDADLLDGQQGSYYTNAANITGNFGTIDFGNARIYADTHRAGLLAVANDTGSWSGMQIINGGYEHAFMADNAGNVGLYNDNNNEWMIYCSDNGAVSLYHNNAQKIYTYASGGRVTGDLLATGDIYAYYSDERLKDKTGKIENALDKVDAIETFYYTHNDKANELGYDGKDQQVGVSAQSVAEVMPEVVHLAPIDDDGQGNSISGENYQTVNYARLVPLLIESIKELRAEVKDLKEQLK